ncbi:MAG TPA: GDP-mannose 4,6-dehydratase, partial [Gemmataceae bacterium]|nr:GDP-mannose 4,6-dehydratase [Gemmataceae bacterium]
MSSAGHGTDFNWQGQKVLVTGASGFKGSWLCGILVNLGAEVYGTVRNRIHPESPYELLDLHDEIVEASADISDRQQVFDLINSIQPTVIFHLAAKA